MLLPEDRLEILVDQLRGFSRRDRSQILESLGDAERRRVEALLRGTGDGVSSSPYSHDVAGRIASLAGAADGMTAAARSALARAVDHKPVPTRKTAHSASLADAVGGMWRSRRGKT